MRARVCIAFAAGLALGIAGALVILSRYHVYTSERITYRVDRFTGRAWVTNPSTMTYWQELGAPKFDPDAYLRDNP